MNSVTRNHLIIVRVLGSGLCWCAVATPSLVCITFGLCVLAFAFELCVYLPSSTLGDYSGPVSLKQASGEKTVSIFSIYLHYCTLYGAQLALTCYLQLFINLLVLLLCFSLLLYCPIATIVAYSATLVAELVFNSPHKPLVLNFLVLGKCSLCSGGLLTFQVQ